MPLDPEMKMQIIAELQQRPDVTPEQRKQLGEMWTQTLATQDKPVLNKSLEVAADVAGAVPIVRGIEMGVKGGARMLFGAGKEAMEREAAAAMAPLQERLVSQTLAKQSLPERVARTVTRLGEEKAGLGEAIGKAEEVSGIAFKSTPPEFVEAMKSPKAIDQFAETLRKIRETPVARLVQEKTAPQLQTLRKFAQTFEDLGPTVDRLTLGNIRGGGAQAGKALAELKPVFGSVVKEWSKVAKKLESLPKSKQLQAKAIDQAMTQTRHAMRKTQAFYRKAIEKGASRDKLRKILAYTGLGVLGVSGAKQFF